jgi:Ser/Thr protein kinase RdoA (MazF antagonist)
VNPLLDFPPFAVLKHFSPHTDGLTWQRVPGGFSGANVWRGNERQTPRLALKAWPPGTAFERVRQVHAWLAQATHLPFVPTVFASIGGQSVCAEAGRVWDCCQWMPGGPRNAPSETEVSAAAKIVAQLHEAWADEMQRGACPGVRNRLRVLAENEPLLRAGPNSLPPVTLHLDPLLRRAVTVVARLAPLAIQSLAPWEHREFALQPCVRDLRGEHILFEGNLVSGIIDFGAMAVDHPAADLARWLGDVVNSDDALFEAGVNTYRAIRPAFDAPNEFVRLLARTGAVCSVLGWLVRLAVRREHPAELLAVSARLESLVSKVAQYTHF